MVQIASTDARKRSQPARVAFAKSLAKLLLPLLLLLTISTSAHAQITGDGLCYTNNNGKISIDLYVGTGNVVNIPSTIDGLPVTTIGDSAFQSCTSLTTVTIPNGVTSIGISTFNVCPSLTSVTIPNSVTSIGGSAFSGCSKLTNVTIPNNLTTLGGQAFYSCTSLTSVTLPASLTSIGSNPYGYCTSLSAIVVSSSNAVFCSVDGILFDKSQTMIIQYPAGKSDNITYAIPNSVTYIGSNAFAGCASLTNVAIPPKVITIGQGAFESCLNLTSLTIPASVTNIRMPLTFSYCPSLTAITVDSSNSVYSSVDGVLCDKSQTTLIVCPAGKADGYIIPSTVTSIGGFAFDSCSSLLTVTIPNSVTSIGVEAFEGCSSLASVTIPSSVTVIGFPAFDYCSGMTSITVDATNPTFSSVGGVLFDKNQTTLLECPPGRVGSYTIPNSVTSIGNAAFASCRSLTSVTIPASVVSIGSSAFFVCSNLTSATFMGNAPSVQSHAFSNLASNFSMYFFNGATGFSLPTWQGYPSHSNTAIPPTTTSNPANKEVASGTTATFTATADGGPAPAVQWQVSTTGTDGVFSNITANSTGTTGVLTLTGVTTAQSGYAYRAVFTNNGGSCSTTAATLTVYPFAFTATSGTVAITAFSGTVGALNIPSTINGLPVTRIGNNAFQSCTTLTSVVIPDSVTSIGYSAFWGCTKLTSATIPTNITSIPSGMFISCSALTSVTIPNSVTSIGTSAFAGCKSLTSVLIPDGLTSIGNSAFQNCTGLTSITIPSGVTSIGSLAFQNCTGLTSVTITNGITTIGSNAFQNCTGLNTVTIPASVITIGSNAFQSCTGLTTIAVDLSNSVYSSMGGVVFDKNQSTLVLYPGGQIGSYTIPNNVTSIGTAAFSSCSGLTGVTIPNSVTSIGSSAFSFCTGLTNVTVPNGVASIGSSAFQGCTGLTSVTIPDGVTSIISSAFSGCTGLTSVTIPDSITSIGISAFYGCTVLKNADFMGNAPSMGSSVFGSVASDFTVSYFNDKSGFTSPTWNGYTTVNMGDSSPIIAAWMFSNGLPNNADLQSAPNRDGVPLLMAYALNLDPTRNQSGSIPRPVVVGNNMSLTYYAASAGITYTVETSPDLKSWDTTGVTLSGPDANNCYTATVPMTGAPCFMRLKVVR